MLDYQPYIGFRSEGSICGYCTISFLKNLSHVIHLTIHLGKAD